MGKEGDHLPWILGGLLLAAAAIAVAIGSNNRAAPENLPPPSIPGRSTAVELPQPAAVAVAAAEPTMPVTQIPAESAPMAVPMPPSGQIWECTTNGQRTFSNNPCGERSSLREVGPINTMEATPILPPTRIYQAQSGYAPDSDPGQQEFVDNSYPEVVPVPVYARIAHVRPPHNHRPYEQGRGPSPRKN
jgi:hypothetical protein